MPRPWSQDAQSYMPTGWATLVPVIYGARAPCAVRGLAQGRGVRVWRPEVKSASAELLGQTFSLFCVVLRVTLGLKRCVCVCVYIHRYRYKHTHMHMYIYTLCIYTYIYLCIRYMHTYVYFLSNYLFFLGLICICCIKNTGKSNTETKQHPSSPAELLVFL